MTEAELQAAAAVAEAAAADAQTQKVKDLLGTRLAQTERLGGEGKPLTAPMLVDLVAIDKTVAKYPEDRKGEAVEGLVSRLREETEATHRTIQTLYSERQEREELQKQLDELREETTTESLKLLSL